MSDKYDKDGYLLKYPSLTELNELFPTGTVVFHKRKGISVVTGHASNRVDVIWITFDGQGPSDPYYADTKYIKPATTPKGNQLS